MFKTREWIQEQFKEAVGRYIPIKGAADLMYREKVKDIKPEEWNQISTFLNSLEFPLTIYRGLRE